MELNCIFNGFVISMVVMCNQITHDELNTNLILINYVVNIRYIHACI